MNNVDNVEEQKDSLDWLKSLQKNSWEPEVIISGIILAFIFIFPAKIYNFSAALVQDYGVNFIGGWLILLYLSFVINVFKIFFILHLCLRFAWAGLLGVSYAFPKGVIQENLFDYSKGLEYRNPTDLVLRLERICSMAFGIPLLLALVFIPFTVYLIVLITIYKVLDLDFLIIYFIFLFTVIAYAVYGILARNTKINRSSAKSVYGSLTAIYTSNIGKWKVNVYFLVIIIFTIPFIIADTKGFFLFFHETNLKNDDIEWPEKSWYFQSFKEKEQRFSRILLPKEEIANSQLKVYLAYYRDDEDYIKTLASNFKTTLDTLQWKALAFPPDLYRFHLDDSVLVTHDWRKTVLPGTSQKAYETNFDVSQVKAGYHTLRVEKLALRMRFFDDGEPRHRKNWAVVTVFKPDE
ncbi:hypothetical protein D770_22625 [Flammeovirgaceae bacterium 311]|nr:hypothetical protein D770_22625 [Flammeovirgaceae bacterium 311]